MRRTIVLLGVLAVLAAGPQAHAKAKKYPADKSQYLECPGYGSYDRYNTSSVQWKVQAGTLLKIAVRNACSQRAIVQWRYKGQVIAFFVPARMTIDLWQSELDPMPRKKYASKDVYFDNEGYWSSTDYEGVDQIWTMNRHGVISRAK